jgi:hypothetical protein
VNVVALVVDLADRVAIGDGVRFVRTPEELLDVTAELALVDLTIPGALDVVPQLTARVIAFGPHVQTDVLTAASAAGAEAMPRSRFFRERPWRD